MLCPLSEYDPFPFVTSTPQMPSVSTSGISHVMYVLLMYFPAVVTAAILFPFVLLSVVFCSSGDGTALDLDDDVVGLWKKFLWS